MNKYKMGIFLKELRTGKNLTINALIKELNREYLGVTVKAVSDWEAGNSIPELEKLLFLSIFYGVTIDEILEGERILKEEDLLNKYYIYGKEFNQVRDNNEYFDKRTKCVEKINKKFKELLLKTYVSVLSNNEEIELSFLFKHKCRLSNFFEQSYPKQHTDDFIELKRVIKDLQSNPTITNLDEFYWEIQKYYEVIREPITSIDFIRIMDEELFGNPFISSLLKQSEPWELDMLVAGLQNFDPIVWNADSNFNYLERYEKLHNKKFNREEIFKSTLKYLLEHGAVLNPFFYNFYKEKTDEHMIIDRLEELYKLCIRPIEIYTFDKEKDGFQKRFFVDNTPFNRFLKEYCTFRNGIYSNNEFELSPHEVFSLVTDDPDNNRFTDLICKLKHIETNRDKDLILADINFNIKSWSEDKEKYLSKEKEVADGLIEINNLEQRLYNGEKKYSDMHILEIGPKSIENLKEYICYWKSKLSLKEFKKQRKIGLTKALLNEIGTLSVSEIKNKYFKKEIIRVGSDHD